MFRQSEEHLRRHHRSLASNLAVDVLIKNCIVDSEHGVSDVI